VVGLVLRRAILPGMALWRRKQREELPEDWEDQIAAIDRRWWDLSVDERTRRRDLMEPLLAGLRWEAARGFEVSDQVRLVIASQAVRPLLGLADPRYPNVRTVIVHATTLVSAGERPGPAPGVYEDDEVVLAGEASHGRGPIVLAWDEVVWDLRHPRRGRNVVVHEFAHKLDMVDDVVDGTPVLLDPALRKRWIEVCTAVFEELDRDGSPVLDDYGAEDPGEFFAVATEAFFTRPDALAHHHPELYEVLAAYFRQDPATAA
jgi:Mlc titration factor MtfA (ptsG expression regulator)